MTLAELKTKRTTILAIARRYGAREVQVFGSVVRGEADAASDVDFLVDLEPGRSVMDLGGACKMMHDPDLNSSSRSKASRPVELYLRICSTASRMSRSRSASLLTEA